ncbi:peptide chain release factor 2 [Texcoconibacillus texcoconensis]|uniref:Peptide chain release factor 2 n=2 Tax=Texcoconibacillus texcoconensis TaxID=1095777 RepID=A0A840QPS9_9BACI|nr:peptide chain release factor 2 [Texcoconibacillus texcoconensis]
MTEPGFWDKQSEAKKVIDESNHLKGQTEVFRKLEETYNNLEVSYELVQEEPDEELIADLQAGLKELASNINDFELQMLLSEPYDSNSAILELHPGAGGTESQDWASMLLRMYTRWSESRGFKVETLDYLPGDEAGVKSVTLLIQGHNAYGYLKAEKGVHRLVRISPFDSSGRRHTSFASCEVTPELEDDVEDVEIRSEDLKIDTYRSSGAGGQHVNTTDSAVRMTHLPTNTVVTCQSERSQIKNREKAMKMLKGKLIQQKIEEQRKEAEEIRGEQSEIGWGSQIRSYVFHPYNMVKDHRTNYETGNTQAVMDGGLTPFIDAYLRSKLS